MAIQEGFGLLERLELEIENDQKRSPQSLDAGDQDDSAQDYVEDDF